MVILLDYLLDITALSEQAQAFRYTRINICLPFVCDQKCDLKCHWFDFNYTISDISHAFYFVAEVKTGNVSLHCHSFQIDWFGFLSNENSCHYHSIL
jgi:hypothetical protein